MSHLSFTGSVAVGALVQAAAARHVAPVTLELGGKSPQAVFADADLERALPFLVNAGIQNAGQTCSAASRILVERRRYGEVVERMAARYRSLKVGPADADLDVGPLISERQKAIVSQFIAEGADLKTAATGEIVADAPRGGHYVAPTLFADVGPGHRLAQEEIFGPVQVVIPFDDEAEAVEIANGTGYGLVAGVMDGRRGPPDAPRQSFARRAGVHQQLRRGRRRRTAVRRRRQIGPWPREGLRSALQLLGAEDRRRVARVRRVLFACAVALTAAGCATPPVVKRDILEARAWRGSALTTYGRQMVVDAAAGHAPQTVTLIDVNARAEVAGDADQRARILDRRVESVRAELSRNGIAPADIAEWPGAGPDGLQTFPPADLQTKPMVVIAHY